MVFRARQVVRFVVAWSIALAVQSSEAATAAPLVSSGELVERADEWNGKRVAFEGEVIGAGMNRGSETWLHVNDDGYARGQAGTGRPLSGYNSGQAVRIPSELARDIRFFGAYQQQGDVVRIEGVFLAADPRAGGDMLIQADTVRLVSRGQFVERRATRRELAAVLVLAITTLLSYGAMRRSERAQR